MFLFQFLIGKLKTGFGYSTITCQIMFQFLIGKLKTKVDDLSWLKEIAEFQFLIGKLKTDFLVVPVHNLSTFQFLIGKLKTLMYADTNPEQEKSFNSS